MKKIVIYLFLLCAFVGGWFVYTEIYQEETQLGVTSVTFEVQKDESVIALSQRLEQEHVIRQPWLFRKYISWKEVDRNIQAGSYRVEAPVTLARVVAAFSEVRMGEKEITIIPGWDLRDIAAYLEKEGFGDIASIFQLTGEPAVRGRATLVISDSPRVLDDKPFDVSLEGYLRPDTYRVFSDAGIEDVLQKLIDGRDDQFTDQMYADIARAGRTVHEVMTVASILEREVRGAEDKKIVADIFWRRLDEHWALQADSTVHYAVGSEGSVFTTKQDRDSQNPWNTYKYAGLPPGPISSPGLESIMAAVYPQKNNFSYFLTDVDGAVHYARTLEEHNTNAAKYL